MYALFKAGTNNVGRLWKLIGQHAWHLLTDAYAFVLGDCLNCALPVAEAGQLKSQPQHVHEGALSLAQNLVLVLGAQKVCRARHL